MTTERNAKCRELFRHGAGYLLKAPSSHFLAKLANLLGSPTSIQRECVCTIGGPAHAVLTSMSASFSARWAYSINKSVHGMENLYPCPKTRHLYAVQRVVRSSSRSPWMVSHSPYQEYKARSTLRVRMVAQRSLVPIQPTSPKSWLTMTNSDPRFLRHRNRLVGKQTRTARMRLGSSRGVNFKTSLSVLMAIHPREAITPTSILFYQPTQWTLSAGHKSWPAVQGGLRSTHTRSNERHWGVKYWQRKEIGPQSMEDFNVRPS